VNVCRTFVLPCFLTQTRIPQATYRLPHTEVAAGKPTSTFGRLWDLVPTVCSTQPSEDRWRRYARIVSVVN
jgi:hypothetical protein